MRLSFPATASRLISAITPSVLADRLRFAHALVLHALGRMKPGLAPIFFSGRPIRRHPGGPAKLAELAQPERLCGTRGDCQLSVAVQLPGIVEENEIGERLAQTAGRQKSQRLGQ